MCSDYVHHPTLRSPSIPGYSTNADYYKEWMHRIEAPYTSSVISGKWLPARLQSSCSFVFSQTRRRERKKSGPITILNATPWTRVRVVVVSKEQYYRKKHGVGPDHKTPHLTKFEPAPCFPRQQDLLLHWTAKAELHPCSSVVLAANLGLPPQIHIHSCVCTKSKHRECTASWSLS